MRTPREIKQLVQDKYAAIAENQDRLTTSGCCSDETTLMREDYSAVVGYNPDADLGLGCGLPTKFAKIKPGDTVLDLGSGAGNDCFVARQAVGEDGLVIGIDMTQAMVIKARRNADKLGATNVDFRLGDIENLPVDADSVDVVVSNCVLNLVPDKLQAFQEIYRVLKPGGHFSISDIVLRGNLPDALRESAELIVGCVAGAQQQEVYLQTVSAAGFTHVEVQKERRINLSGDALVKHLSEKEVAKFSAGEKGIYSITVYAEKA